MVPRPWASCRSRSSPDVGASIPSRPRLDRRGRLTHGRLPENVDAHAVRPNAFPDPRRLPRRANHWLRASVVHIHDFAYSQGEPRRPRGPNSTRRSCVPGSPSAS